MTAALVVLMLMAAPVAGAELPQVAVEAEDYAAVDGGTVHVLEREQASGGRCVSYWEDPGVAVTCRFEVAQAGEYCLTLRYACRWPDTRRQVSIDGEVVSGLRDVLLPGTGSWADFTALTVPGADGGRARIALEAGAHRLTLTNVDSRGLAWDQALLHGPGVMPADAPLSGDEMTAFLRTLPPQVRSLAEPRRVDDRAGNGVALAVGDDGGLVGWRAGDVLAVVSESEAPRSQRPGRSPLTERRLGALRVAHRAAEDAGTSDVRATAYVTDGRALYVIGVSAGTDDEAAALPAPVMQWRGDTAWRLAPRTVVERLDGRGSAIIGDVELSSIAPMHAGTTDARPPRALLSCERVALGGGSVHAWRVGRRLLPGDSSIAVGAVAGGIVIRSATDLPPAVAEFYGVPRFRVVVHPDLRMTVTSDDGDVLELPSPAAQ